MLGPGGPDGPCAAAGSGADGVCTAGAGAVSVMCWDLEDAVGAHTSPAAGGTPDAKQGWIVFRKAFAISGYDVSIFSWLIRYQSLEPSMIPSQPFGFQPSCIISGRKGFLQLVVYSASSLGVVGNAEISVQG